MSDSRVSEIVSAITMLQELLRQAEEGILPDGAIIMQSGGMMVMVSRIKKGSTINDTAKVLRTAGFKAMVYQSEVPETHNPDDTKDNNWGNSNGL